MPGRLHSRQVDNSDTFVERNAYWSGVFNKLITQRPEFLLSISEDTVFVFMPESDPELCAFNLEMARYHGSNVTFVRLIQNRKKIEVQRFIPQPVESFALA